MKVLFCSTLFDYWGGSEELWVRTAKKLQDQNHSIALALYPQKTFHPKVQELINNGANLIRWRSITGNETLEEKIVHKLQKKLQPNFIVAPILKHTPDVIVLSQGDTFGGIINNDFYELLKKTSSRIFIIAQLNHEHWPLEYSAIERAREIFRKAEKVIFVSHRNKEVAERQIAQKIPNAFVVDNPLNLSSIEYIPYPESEQALFASVARFDVKFKAQDILFQVLGQQKWKERNWRLNLYGDGKDKQYIEDLIRLYGLSDKVSLKGHVSDIREVWAENQILLLPSIAEGKPLALQEAMFCGRTAVVTDVAGNTELIENRTRGFIVEAPTPMLVDKALEEAWMRKNSWKEIGKEAYLWAEENINTSPEQTITKLILECRCG